MQTLVIVHRSVWESSWPLPWSKLLSRAESGADGLRVWQGKHGDEPMMRPREKNEPYGWTPGWDDWDEIAMLRHNDAKTDIACLFKQNWPTLSQRPLSMDPVVVAEWEKAKAAIEP